MSCSFVQFESVVSFKHFFVKLNIGKNRLDGRFNDLLDLFGCVVLLLEESINKRAKTIQRQARPIFQFLQDLMWLPLNFLRNLQLFGQDAHRQPALAYSFVISENGCVEFCAFN